jgi:hypothetical protein
MDTGSDASQTAGATVAKGGRFRSVAMIVVFDIAAPLAAYNLLRSAGLTTVMSLILSGVFPAVPVSINAIRHRRIEAVGALVLAGIVVGSVLGLVSHSARLVLVEGSVPTGVFGVGCLGSLWARYPLMFTFFTELLGPDSAKAIQMAALWRRYEGFRRDMRVITAVWGVAFLIEAALRVVIVFNTSTGTALTISKVTPFLFGGIMSAWTVAYGTYRRKKAEKQMTAAGQAGGPGQAGGREAIRVPH